MPATALMSSVVWYRLFPSRQGNCLVLELTGNLMDEFDGTAFVGEDVVRIIKKVKD